MSLVSALFVMLAASLAIALIGYLMFGSLKVSREMKLFKSTKEAAESVAHSVIGTIESGNLSCPSVGCSPDATPCPIDLPPAVERALEASNMTATAYLLRRCETPQGTLYTVEVNATAESTGTKTVIYFIYQN